MLNWEDRGKLKVCYKGEDFYTISPLPFYIKRRKILLGLMDKYIFKAKIVLDYGCGDGWYVNHFSGKVPDIEIEGCDISTSFLEKARSDFPEYHFFGIEHLEENSKYDLIYIFAVFAHLEKETIFQIIENLSKCLNPGGKLILFEQVARKHRTGRDFIKREISEYQEIVENSGYEVKEGFLISFKVYNFIEKKFLNKILRIFSNDRDPYVKRIRANSNSFYRFIIRLLLMLDWFPVKINPKAGYGNYLLIAEKKSE